MAAEITYPVLLNAGAAGVGTDYSCSHHYYFVIGGNGIVKWRGTFNSEAITAAIDEGLAELSLVSVGALPERGFALEANYPNPFNPSTSIPYDLHGDAGSAQVRLEVLDLRGRIVRTLISERQPTGQRYTAQWNGLDAHGRAAASGVYLSRLTVDGEAQTRLLTLTK